MSDSSSSTQAVLLIEKQVDVQTRSRGHVSPLEKEQQIQYTLRLQNNSYTPVNQNNMHLDSTIYSIQSKCEHQTRVERYKVDQQLHKVSVSKKQGKQEILYILNALAFPNASVSQYPSVYSSPLTNPSVVSAHNTQLKPEQPNTSKNKSNSTVINTNLTDALLIPDALALLLGYPGNYVQIHNSSTILPLTASASSPYDSSSGIIIQPSSTNTAHIDGNTLSIMSGIAYSGLQYQYIYEYCNLHRNNIQSTSRHASFHAFISYIDSCLQEYTNKVVALQHRTMQTATSLRSVYIWSLQNHQRQQDQYNICQYTRGQSTVALLESLSSTSVVQMDSSMYHDMLQKTLTPLTSLYSDYLSRGYSMDADNEGFITFDEHGKWHKTILDINKVPSLVSFNCATKITKIAQILLFLHRQCDTPVYFSFARQSILPSTTTITVSQHYNETSPLSHEITRLFPIVCSNHVEDVAEHLQGPCNSILHHILTNRFHLTETFTILHNVFLGSRSDVLHSILRHTASVLNSSVGDTSVLHLQQLLNVSLQSLPKHALPSHLVDKLHVELQRGGIQERIADVFSMHYNLDEPLSILFNRNILDIYKRIFTLLLRTTRAVQDIGQVFQLHKHYRNKNLPKKVQNIILKSQIYIQRTTLAIQHISSYIHQCLREYTHFMQELLVQESNIEVLQKSINDRTQDLLSKQFLSSASPGMQNSLTFIARIIDIILQWKFVVSSFYNSFNMNTKEISNDAIEMFISRVQVLTQSFHKIVPAFLQSLEQLQQVEEVASVSTSLVLDILQPTKWSDANDHPSCIHARIQEMSKEKVYKNQESPALPVKSFQIL